MAGLRGASCLQGQDDEPALEASRPAAGGPRGLANGECTAHIRREPVLRLSLLSLCPSLPSGQSPPSQLPLLVRLLPPAFFFSPRCSFRATVSVPIQALSSPSSLPSFLLGCLGFSPSFLGLCFSCSVRVLSVPWFVLVDCSSAVSLPSLLPSLLPRVDADPTKGCQCILPSPLKPPPSPACPALWLGPEPACSLAPSQGLGEGSLGEDQEKAQCALGAEHSDLSWARCHQENL